VLAQLLESISGVPVTPFCADVALDEPSLAAVVERMAGQGVQVIVPCGGTGEFSALSAEERDRGARITIEAAGTTPVIVGVGSARATTRATTCLPSRRRWRSQA
jgi:4-hydroxy-tetrahydrodipicolinate synthase